MCSGFVYASHTNSRGALSTRVNSISSFSMFARTPVSLVVDIVLLLLLKALKVVLQSVHPFLEEDPVLLQPVSHVLQWLGLQPARPPLGLARAGDQSSPLEDLEMARDRREADLERRRQFGHGRFSLGQASEDREAYGVGECGEGLAQVLVFWRHLTLSLINTLVKYNTRPAPSRAFGWDLVPLPF